MRQVAVMNSKAQASLQSVLYVVYHIILSVTLDSISTDNLYDRII